MSLAKARTCARLCHCTRQQRTGRAICPLLPLRLQSFVGIERGFPIRREDELLDRDLYAECSLGRIPRGQEARFGHSAIVELTDQRRDRKAVPFPCLRSPFVGQPAPRLGLSDE